MHFRDDGTLKDPSNFYKKFELTHKEFCDFAQARIYLPAFVPRIDFLYLFEEQQDSSINGDIESKIVLLRSLKLLKLLS